MLAIERRHAIVRIVNEQGSATHAQLAALFDVSSETVRKDLVALEKDGLLARTHGGAIRAGDRPVIAPLRERQKDHITQKRELCGYALRFIRNGDTLALDEGSTAAELAKLLVCTFNHLTIATASLEVFGILRENPGFKLILCGGEFIRDELSFSGMLTIATIRSLHFDKAFIFPSGISARYGIMDMNDSFITIQQAFIERADSVFILAYSDRFSQSSSIKLTDLRQDFTYITDSSLPEDIDLGFKKQNIHIIKE